MYVTYKSILPEVAKQLAFWESVALSMPDQDLQKIALDSLKTRRFHSQGGALLAGSNLAQKSALIALLVAFQTLSDYLDNLCDRRNATPENCLQLHRSMQDVLLPVGQFSDDYYALQERKQDGGYLNALVCFCQKIIAQFPKNAKVLQLIADNLEIFVNYQAIKQYPKEEIDTKIKHWSQPYLAKYPDLNYYEFFSGGGSTLSFHALFTLLSDPSCDDNEVDRIAGAYFPYINAMHVLMDYFIDQEEDASHDEFNAIAYFKNEDVFWQRLLYIAERAQTFIMQSVNQRFHQIIIEGTFYFYLSDPKIANYREITKKIFNKNIVISTLVYLNSLFIKKR